MLIASVNEALNKNGKAQGVVTDNQKKSQLHWAFVGVTRDYRTFLTPKERLLTSSESCFV